MIIPCITQPYLTHFVYRSLFYFFRRFGQPSCYLSYLQYDQLTRMRNLCVSAQGRPPQLTIQIFATNHLSPTQHPPLTLRRVRKRLNRTNTMLASLAIWSLTSCSILPTHHPHAEHLTPRRENACIHVALTVNLHTATKSTSCSSCIMLSTDSNLP